MLAWAFQSASVSSIVLIVVALLAGGSSHADELDNPAVPLVPVLDGRPIASKVRVALVDSGVNYQLPQINNALARDAKGELIGYDFWDMDNRPFDSHPTGRGPVQRHGTRTASLLINEAPFIELVAYRYPRPDMQRMASLVAHADQHGVRIIGCLLYTSPSPRDS